MDEVRIYKRALTATEINSIRTTNSTAVANAVLDLPLGERHHTGRAETVNRQASSPLGGTTAASLGLAPAERITISVGIATLAADLPLSEPGELLQRADQALYRAKREGRNRVVAERA